MTDSSGGRKKRVGRSLSQGSPPTEEPSLNGFEHVESLINHINDPEDIDEPTLAELYRAELAKGNDKEREKEGKKEGDGEKEKEKRRKKKVKEKKKGEKRADGKQKKEDRREKKEREKAEELDKKDKPEKEEKEEETEKEGRDSGFFEDHEFDLPPIAEDFPLRDRLPTLDLKNLPASESLSAFSVFSPHGVPSTLHQFDSPRTLFNTPTSFHNNHNNNTTISYLSPDERIIRLNIGGFIFETTRDTLLNTGGENYFTSLLSGRIPSTVDRNGAYFIDRDGQYFSPILTYLRTGELRIPPTMSARDVLCEAKFYMIQEIADRLRSTLRPKSSLYDFESILDEGRRAEEGETRERSLSTCPGVVVGGVEIDSNGESEGSNNISHSSNFNGYPTSLKQMYVRKLMSHPKAKIVCKRLVQKILWAATQRQQGGRLIVMDSGEDRTVSSTTFGSINVVSSSSKGSGVVIDIIDKDCVQYFSSGIGIEVFKHYFRSQQIEMKIERLQATKVLVGVMFMFNVHFIDEYSAKPVYLVRQ